MEVKKSCHDADHDLHKHMPIDTPVDYPKENEAEFEYRTLMNKWWFAAAVSIPTILVSYPDWFPLIKDWLPMESTALWWSRVIVAILTIPVLAWSGRQFFTGMWEGLKHRSANMHTLISTGVSAAWIYSIIALFWPEWFPDQAMAEVYYDVTTVVTALVVLGMAMEVKAKGRSSEAIKKLIGLQPKTAHVIRNDQEMEILVEDIVIGDIVVVKPGEKLAIDGVVVEGWIEGRHTLFGNLRLMKKEGIPLEVWQDYAARLADEGKTPMFLAVDGMPAGILAVADTLKEDSAEAICQMKKMGLEVVMITGDNERTAKAIAKQVGIDRLLADVLPQDKAENVRKLQAEGKKVAMVGDGINDAPALTQADIGIAIGTGTDVAIEASDITLIKGSLKGVVYAIQISRATMRNVYQNLFGAFIYNMLGLPVALGILYPFLGVLLSPLIAAAAMAFSSVTVIANANRLRRFKPKEV